MRASELLRQAASISSLRGVTTSEMIRSVSPTRSPMKRRKRRENQGAIIRVASDWNRTLSAPWLEISTRTRAVRSSSSCRTTARGARLRTPERDGVVCSVHYYHISISISISLSISIHILTHIYTSIYIYIYIYI